MSPHASRQVKHLCFGSVQLAATLQHCVPVLHNTMAVLGKYICTAILHTSMHPLKQTTAHPSMQQKVPLDTICTVHKHVHTYIRMYMFMYYMCTCMCVCTYVSAYESPIFSMVLWSAPNSVACQFHGSVYCACMHITHPLGWLYVSCVQLFHPQCSTGAGAVKQSVVRGARLRSLFEAECACLSNFPHRTLSQSSCLAAIVLQLRKDRLQADVLCAFKLYGALCD